MNALDVAVLSAVAIGGLVGFRVGFVIRALSWLGLSVGLILGLRLTPRVARALSTNSPGIRLLAVSALLIGLALIGHATGLVASQTLRARLSLSNEASALDRWTGGILGALGALALLWLLIPALQSTPGWPARAVRDSSMVALIDRYAPAAPRAARVLGRIVGDEPYPVFSKTTDTGRPPVNDAGPRVDAGAAASVVLVQGNACGLQLSGTGFAVAPALIVTNAHVVAGEHHTRVTTTGGARFDARVVAFDGRHDVAVLQVPKLALRPLDLGRPRLGTVASVLGHPGGGRLRATPARVARWITASRSDIYRSATIRTAIVGLAAHLIVGDSGAPVIGSDGRVQAMVFAIDPARVTTAFALSSGELRPFVRAAGHATAPVSTGTCLND